MISFFTFQCQDPKSRRFKIGAKRGSNWPDLSLLGSYFRDYDRRKWIEHGSDEGIFTTTVENGQGTLSVSLVFVAPPNELGLHIRFSITQSGQFREDYYCLWDRSRLGDNFEEVHNSFPMSNSLIIPHDLAFKALKDFIESDGAMPKCIEWTESRDLPPEALPVPENQV